MFISDILWHFLCSYYFLGVSTCISFKFIAAMWQLRAIHLNHILKENLALRIYQTYPTTLTLLLNV